MGLDAWDLGHAEDDGRDGEEHGDAVSWDEVEEEVHVEAAHVDLGGPRGDGGVHQNGHAVAVKEGEVDQKDVVLGGGGGLAGALEGLFEVAGEVEVGEHDALWGGRWCR